MDIDTLIWLWVIGGGVLMASELVVPGMITFFLGLSAFVVALGYKLGFLERVLPGFTTWFIVSLFCVFFLREFAKKLLPGDSKYKSIDEDYDAFGKIVDVIEDISVKHTEGRIRFRGTTWKATTSAKLIPAGKKAKIVARDNLVWIVEPFDKVLLDEIQPEDSVK
jgi:membrane protein implicated in regulation of membrane protease activity